MKLTQDEVDFMIRKRNLLEQLKKTGQEHLFDLLEQEELAGQLDRAGHFDSADRVRAANDLFDACIGKKK